MPTKSAGKEERYCLNENSHTETRTDAIDPYAHDWNEWTQTKAPTEEWKDLVAVGWSDEGWGWMAPLKSNTPVYRLYNANGGEHHYTMDEKEKDSLVKAGWSYEGIGWYSDDAKTVPLFREYNPNQLSCNHNYTTSKAEHDWLVSLGWKDEGQAWYGACCADVPAALSEW